MFDNLDKWSEEFDKDFNKLINKYKDYTIDVLNIEREQKKPRKDFACYSEIKNSIWYMYDELFFDKDKNYQWQNITDKEEIISVLDLYFDKYYDVNDDKDTWFNKMKEACEETGYCANMKEYKINPDNYKGSIADFSMIIRVALTTKSMTPDLYEIMNLLGLDRIKKRIDILR